MGEIGRSLRAVPGDAANLDAKGGGGSKVWNYTKGQSAMFIMYKFVISFYIAREIFTIIFNFAITDSICFQDRLSFRPRIY